MQRKWIFGLSGLLLALSAALGVLAGCGGSGGSIIPPETGPAPSVSAQFLDLLPAAQKNATFVGSDRCSDASCHGGTHSKAHGDWSQTRHAQVNVGCEQCHGGGSAHVANPTKDNILTYPLVTRSIVCGQCHGPTHEQFKESRHASPVEAVVEEGISNPATYVRTCFRCHSAAFRAQFVDRPTSEGKTPDEINDVISNLPTDQMLDIAHKTLESASCSNCHNPHAKTGKLTSDGNEAQLRRKTFNLDTTGIAPGVPVKTYTTYDHTCGSCHNARGGNPSDTALTSGTARPNMHNSNQMNMLLGLSGVEGNGPVQRTGSHTQVPDQCVHCHVPAKRHTFTVSFDTSCAPCHTATDAAARAGATKSEIQSSLLVLRGRMERWAQATFGNSVFWDYTSLITAEDSSFKPPDQSLIPIEVKRARHNYYFVLRDKSFGIHNLFYTRHLINTANAQLDAAGIGRAAAITRSPAQMKAILEKDLQRANAADKQADHVW